MKIFLQELCKGNWEYVFRVPRLKMFPIMNFYRPHLGVLSILICDHCNLNCKGCGALAPLAEEWFVEVDQLEKDVKELAKKLTIRTIFISGGEALLHPQIDKILYVVRNAFPKTKLLVGTNGLLIFKMPDSFWKAMRDCNAKVQITVYPPLEEKMPEIFQYVKAKMCKLKFRFEIFSDNDKASKYWQKQLFSFNKSYGSAEGQYKKCWVNDCIDLKGHLLYHCPMHFLQHYNRYFHEEHELIKGYDIYQHSGWELMKAMTSPMPQCAHCKVPWERDTWDYSKREKSEWVEE